MPSNTPTATRCSPIKTPERCPSCNSRRIAPKGSREKKFETIPLYCCRSCCRNFTPGPRALRNKTYPLNEILEALTTYNRGLSLEETARRLSSRYGHRINPATISRWLAAHPRLTTYRRLRARGLKLFKAPQVIRTVKLYHRQVYEFAYHRAKLAFLRDGTLDDKRSGDMRFAGLADFLESAHQRAPHELFRREDREPDARTSKPIAQLTIYALALTRLVPGLKLFDITCAWFNETCYNESIRGMRCPGRNPFDAFSTKSMRQKLRAANADPPTSDIDQDHA